MIIAQKLKQSNIAEYLLYMWQVEDLIRANRLDIDQLEQTYLSKFQLEEAAKQELREWYENLIEMMRSEGVAEKGHLQINKNILILLNDVHTQLLHSSKHPFYAAAYYKALPFIVELRAKHNGASSEKGELENCFDAMYGLMLLRLQGKAISDDTLKAMDSISKFLGMLAEYYKKDKAGEVEY